VLRYPVLAALQSIEARIQRRLRRAGNPSPIIARNTLPAIDHLFAENLCAKLHWPLRHRPGDFVALRDGIAGLDAIAGVSGVMFFGGQVRSKRIVEMERKVAASARRIDARLGDALAWYRSKELIEPLGYGGLVQANPRARHEVLQLKTIPYRHVAGSGLWRWPWWGLEGGQTEAWEPSAYRVPVFSMVDIVGEERARELLSGTKFDGVNWVAIKGGRFTAPAMEWLIKGYFWSSESTEEFEYFNDTPG
jgi:hypothetical protein